MLYSVFPICGYMDSYLELFQDIFSKMFMKALQSATDSHLILVEHIRKICCTTLVIVVTSLQSIPDSNYAEGYRDELF